MRERKSSTCLAYQKKKAWAVIWLECVRTFMGRKHWVIKCSSDAAEKDSAFKKSLDIKSRQIQIKNMS